MSNTETDPNPSIDLISLLLTLRPTLQSEPDKPLPLWWGRAAHGLLLNTIRTYDPTLAEALHATDLSEQSNSGGTSSGDQPLSSSTRPFTASNLMGRFKDERFAPGETYTLRLTAFQGQLADIIMKAASDGPLAPEKIIELDYMPFRIETNCWASNQHLWAGVTNFQELGASLLLAKESAPRRLSLQFTSPTTFKSGGKHVPLPLPEMVFGSLLERWNTYAPITFPSEARRYAAECLGVGRYKISTRRVPVKRGGLRIGFVGEVTFTSLNYDRYWMSVMGTLAEFALFSGVGGGTSMGMGQCRQIVNK